MSDDIPFEIQVDIIKRLDVKSLIQFRSVSKQWKSLIDSSDFITSYGVRHTYPQRLLIRFHDPISIDEKYIFLVDDETFAFTPTVVPGQTKPLKHSKVVGTSHGLLCLYGDYSSPTSPTDHYPGRKTSFLWNPSIRRYVGIVMPTVRKSMFEKSVVGFGVCPVSSDPIIINITYRSSILFEAHVFTLSSRIWKRIPSTYMPHASITITWSQVVIDKFIYLLAYDKNDQRYLIMSFDLTLKEFKEINLPDYLAHEFCILRSIHKLRESLVVLEYNIMVDNPVCDVWMMDQGITKSFTKLYTINTPYASINTFLGFRKNGQPILEMQDRYTNSVAIEVYDPCSEHVSDLGICGEFGSFFMSSYMETLLLLDYLDCTVYSNIN